MKRASKLIPFPQQLAILFYEGYLTRNQDLRLHDQYAGQVALSQMGRFTSLVMWARVPSGLEAYSCCEQV
jgi:hypothetical protein